MCLVGKSWLDVKLKHLRLYRCLSLCCSGETNGITEFTSETQTVCMA